MSTFDEKRARSLVIERALVPYLQRQGWYVQPTYAYSGKEDNKAPKLLSPSGCEDLILPDLQAFRENEARWWEAKLKEKAVFFRKTGHTVTGCCKRLYRHYREVQRVTQIPVWLVFAHEAEREVRGASLDVLDDLFDQECGPNREFRHGARFYRYLQIPHLCSLDELLGDAVLLGAP